MRLEGSRDGKLGRHELEEERADFRKLFEESSSVMLVIDPSSGKIVAANPAAASSYGYACQRLTGMLISEISLGPAEAILSDLRRASHRKHNHFKLPHRTASGEVRDVDVYSSPIVVNGRRLLYAIVHDVSERVWAEKNLSKSEKRFRSTFEQVAVAMAHATLQGRILRCNARFAEIIGYTSREAQFLSFQQITPAQELDDHLRALTGLTSGESDVARWEQRLVRKDGSVIWVKLTFSTQRDDEGKAVHYIAVVEDIDERRATEQRLVMTMEALRVSEAHYRTIFQTSLDGICISQLSNGRVIDANRAFLNLIGLEREDVVGRTSLELNLWADYAARQKMEESLVQGRSFRDSEIQFRKANGELISVLVSAATIAIEDVTCVLAVVRDISAAKLAENEIRNLAFYDPLTHLPNRRLVSERLRHALASGARSHRRGALLFIDLDNFKTLNDTLGHTTGDLLLQEIARRLTACTRNADTVAHLGGDEFVVILEDLGETAEEAAAHARVVAGKIHAAVRLSCVLAGRECLSTCSVGIAVFGDRGHSADDVLQQADIAMFQAKAAGRNTSRFFAPALQTAITARALLEEDLRLALATAQFTLFYQPQVETGTLIGAEALLRWNHPLRGLRAPDEFIPVAEETGMIEPLGVWVLETACAQIAAWSRHKETAHLTVGVNISARQLRGPDFVEQMLNAVNRTGANPRNLTLELTESMLVDNVDDVIAKMINLKSHGMRFALDDFGTGYSSLSYLKRFPLDMLKIDRTFVRDILVDPTSAAIAQTIISLSRVMGLSVIAEGVETEQQREFLASLGCHAYQGYLFSKPVPLQEFQLLAVPRQSVP